MRVRVTRGLLFLGLGVALVDGIFGQRGMIENVRLRARNDAVAASVEAVSAENAALREDVRRLIEDPSAIEELARRELGLIKKGELLVILRDAPAPPQPSATASKKY